MTEKDSAAVGSETEMADEEEDRAFLSSCCSEGVEYSLYDIVKVFDKRFTVPHIGKILKIWEERSSGARKALVCWFLWHKEVKPHDADNPKELFLAFGNEKGATNELNMESIVGKCKVVCTSNDPRNKEPSACDIENADFVFSHAFDVDLKSTFPVEVVADKMGPDVVYNTEEWLIAITNIEGKTNEFRTKQLSKSPLTESKKRPRNAEVVSNVQNKKIDKLDDLKKRRISSEETIKKKKIVVSDGKAPVMKEKSKEGSDSKQEDMVQRKKHLTTNETLNRLGKTQLSDVKKPASTEGADLNKAPSPRTLSNDMGDVLEQTDSIIESIVRKINDETILREKSKSEGTQELENRADNSLKVEKAQAEGKEEADQEKTGAPDLETLDSDFPWREDPSKGMAKKEKSFLIGEPEKRLTSAAKPVKPFDRRKIFKDLPWEESLQRGIPQGRVLHLQNIDPLVTSANMREMLRSTFDGISDAQVLPKDRSCPSGQAVAIFESRMLAESALEAIERHCLVMADKKWPLLATRVKESVNQTKFPGHLALEKLKMGRSNFADDWKKALATSHCSQPNTIEFEMAMEWRQMQEVTQNCRIELFKKHRKELSDLGNQSSSKGQKPKQDNV